MKRRELALALRLALREMRGGLRGFYVFLACIALGTGTIAAVNSLAYGLTDSIRAEGQSILGGDVSFSLIHRQASPEERAWLEAAGRVSTAATLRAMARPEAGKQTLVEVKGVDTAYPLYGAPRLASGRPLGEVLQLAAVDGAAGSGLAATSPDVGSDNATGAPTRATVSTANSLSQTPGGPASDARRTPAERDEPAKRADTAAGASPGARSGGAATLEVPALVEPAFLTQTGLAVGDTFALGRLTVRIADVLDFEPDRLSGGLAFGPRVMLPVDALERSGLVGTGSLVRWRYRVAGRDRPFSDSALDALVKDANAAFPSAGWRVELRSEAAQGLRQSIDRFAQFLTLVGLTSLAVGGVGVANAVRAYLAGKRATIATLRAMGAPARLVVATYFAQILMLASIGVVIGLVLGALAPPIAAVFLADLLPVSGLEGVFPGALALAALYGIATAAAFAIWPLGRAHAVPASALFRDAGADAPARVRPVFVAATAGALLFLAALAVGAAYDRFLAFLYVIAAAAIFAALRGIAILIVWAARALPRSRSTVVRLAVGNIHRRGALTPTVTLSLGLSLTLLVTLSLIDGNLRQTLMSRLPAEAPSFFFVDIQDADRDAFVGALAELAPEAKVRSQPMLRGRIVSINGTPAADWPDTEASWVLRGDRGITYDRTLPEGSEIVYGAWWPPEGPADNELSFAANLAEELGVKVGDTLRVNVLGREVEAKITNLRTVEWETLAINFVMIFSPNVFAGAPHAHIATLTFPGGADDAREQALLKEITDRFPTVTAIRVKEALETVNDVVADLVLAIRAAAALTLIASMLVLAGTLAASHRARIYDAVILKTLGARRRTLIGAYVLEYLILGTAAAVFGVAAGVVAARFIAVELMELKFALMPGAALGATALAVAVTVGLGLIGTWRALGEEPARVLRNL